MAAAASIILLITGAAYYLLNNEKPKQQQASQHIDADVSPGKEGAILTLADGRKVILDNQQQGVIANEKNNKITLSQGRISYQNFIDKNSNEIYYNTLSTPKGRVYQLLLTDGTKVWLNSASSITYPVAFNENTRTVTITGEAYFEVAKQKHKPFYVKAGTATVQVLGTHFNVNSYHDENNITTTLLEGSIMVKQNNNSILLKPGQQVQNGRNTNDIPKVIMANTEEVMAWKNGFFQFNDANLQSVMRQLSRWYDVEIKYEGIIPDKKLVGEIPKDSKII